MKKLLCILLICLLLTGCAGVKPAQRTVFAMDTVMELQVWGKEANKALDALEKLLKDMDGRWSATDTGSALYAYNNNGTVSWTADEAAFLQRANRLSRRTDGAFSPKLYALMDAWGFYDDSHSVPSQEQITKALADERMDLGGIVKGYAGDQAVQLLKQYKVDRAILNLGGNIQTYGEKPNGEAWQIGIQDPDGGAPLGTVKVHGTMAIVTSGDYQRYFEKDGVKYHHIMDPKTGVPAQSGLRSVTVISKDGTLADALSTSFFVMGLEKGSEFWRSSSDFEVVFVTDGGKIYATEGVKLSECTYEVIRREK